MYIRITKKRLEPFSSTESLNASFRDAVQVGIPRISEISRKIIVEIFRISRNGEIQN